MNTKKNFQSYLQEEVEELVLDGDALEQWERLVDELGLEGQRSTTAPKKSPNPFLRMTPSMVATFETLCPREAEYQKYSAGTIPIEALDLIALAVREKYYDRIMIRWDDKSPDPVAIGERISMLHPHEAVGEMSAWSGVSNRAKQEEIIASGVPYSTSIGDRYLIARWGAENKPLEELALLAKARYMRERGADLNKRIKKAQVELNTMEEDATQRYGC